MFNSWTECALEQDWDIYQVVIFSGGGTKSSNLGGGGGEDFPKGGKAAGRVQMIGQHISVSWIPWVSIMSCQMFFSIFPRNLSSSHRLVSSYNLNSQSEITYRPNTDHVKSAKSSSTSYISHDIYLWLYIIIIIFIYLLSSSRQLVWSYNLNSQSEILELLQKLKASDYRFDNQPTSCYCFEITKTVTHI